MTRPERTKRPRLAADASVLPIASSSKRQKISHVSPPPVTRSSSVRRSGSQRKASAQGSDDDDANPNEEQSNDVVLTPVKKRNQLTRSSSSSSPLSDLPEDVLQEHLPQARRRILSILSGQLPPPGCDRKDEYDGSECVGLSEQWRNLRATVMSTMQGEGNSAVLVGARGSGKSLLLKSVLRSVDAEKEVEVPTYHLVELDGAIQTTDRLSMRELARQLVKKGAIKVPKEGEKGALDFGTDEEEVSLEQEEEEETTINGHDGGDEEEEDAERQAVTNAILSSVTNTTSTILTLLSSESNRSKALPLIITLSSFDLYTSRPRQALLYVLLDAVQAGSYTPGLCVIGMTSRLDTTDLLEKRVKSRFGGRTINVWPEDVWLEATKKALQAGFVDEERGSKSHQAFNRAWRKEMDQFCKDETLKKTLEEARSHSNVIRTLYKILYPIIAALSLEEPSLLDSLKKYQLQQTNQSSYSILSDLTLPEFGLLIASKQLLNRDREVFNFEMCFDELKRFVSRVEMDRLGSAAVTTSSATNTPNGNHIRINGRSAAAAAAASSSSSGMMWQGLTDRKRVMMAFRSLLQLELFQPEVALNTLSMVPSISIASAAARAAQAVRTEYFRVKCTIFPQDIIAAAKSKSRNEALGTHLAQWVTNHG